MPVPADEGTSSRRAAPELVAPLESYPSEFISHLHPLLFVAGLGPANLAPPAPLSAPGAAPPGAAPPPTNGVDPSATTAPTPASTSPDENTISSDPFASLVTALRKVLQARKGWGIWDNSRGAHNDVHIVLVDKNVRFPPIKARPVSAPPGQAPAPLHSPISPLTPSSPLYPDGIMAPIWIRKHREMIPSVFVLVLRIHEFDYAQGAGPLDAANAKEEDERHHDAELVREILDRKRLTSERGIKLAVVLLCSRRLLDDPALDSRLSLVRRQSGLDSRASLFVISPVPQAEVNNFVLSLKGELFPAALDYYREHGRRVRRKRARQMPKGGLSDKGWNVRYDYKMALFSEMRGEIEVALKHYEDCYNTLLDMFANSILLPPRTKRWAEAKVLADCLTVKVAKMYLYLNEPSSAVAQLNRHVTRFRELSNIWGIGDKTFEFWSWLSKQYRLFGDLVATGIRAGFRLPLIRPAPSTRALPPGAPPPPISSLVPSTVLQHPGHYFFLAATCAVERRERFRAVMVAYEAARDAAASAPVPEGGKKPPPLGMGPALTHETKVDHAEVIIDLYTKAYEFFKAHKTKNMTFYVAGQIAMAHFESGNHEMALKFHDRIAKNYRKDKWSGVLDSILQLSFESAQRIGDWEAAIRCCLELMAPNSRISADERAKYSATTLELMQTYAPTSPEQAVISITPADSAPLFDCQLVFWKPSTDIGHAVPFQLALRAPPTSRTSAFVFSELAIAFSDGRAPIVVSHSNVGTSSTKAAVEVVRLGRLDDEATTPPTPLSANLCWRDGSTKVFEATVESSSETSLTINHVILKAKIGEWSLSVTLEPEGSLSAATAAEWYLESGHKMALSHDRANVCIVSARQLLLDIAIEHDSPAYVGEAYPIHVDLVNDDGVDIDVFLDILLQPGEDDSPNQITIDDQSSLSFIKGIALGTLAPGSRLRKTMQLDCVGSAGDRLLDLSFRAVPTGENSSSPPRNSSPSMLNGSPVPLAHSTPFTELLRSVAVPVLDPLHSAFRTSFHQKRRALKPLMDLTPPDGWDSACDVTVVGTLHAAGPWDVEVTGLKLMTDRLEGVRVVQTSLAAHDGPLSLHWRPGDLFNCLLQLEVAVPLLGQELSGAFIEVFWRRQGLATQPSRTVLPLPRLQPFPLETTVTLALPPTLHLHEPVTLRYRFSNPTTRVVTLSTSVEGAEPGTFTFAGPRKVPSLVLAPDEERALYVVVVPLVVGMCALPRMRVFHHERVPVAPVGETEGEEGSDPSAPREWTRRARELRVVAEMDVHEVKDPAQLAMEENLRAARGGDRLEDTVGNPPPPPFVVMILPR